MTRPAICLLLVLALAGCGSKHKAAPTTTAAPVDAAACNQLEGYIRLVSQVISSSVEAMTQSTHPKELAKRTGTTQRNLASAAGVLARLQLPATLDPPRRQLVHGLQPLLGRLRPREDLGRPRRPRHGRAAARRPAGARARHRADHEDRSQLRRLSAPRLRPLNERRIFRAELRGARARRRSTGPEGGEMKLASCVETAEMARRARRCRSAGSGRGDRQRSRGDG